MSSTFIATTPRASYNAMRYQGILVTDSYAQLRAMLEKNLSPRHALLLAEPMHEASGSSIDWYTAAQGSPVPLESLSPEEKAKAGAVISSLASDIDQLAGELKQSAEGPKTIRGNILSLALRYPDPAHLYMVGDQPVIVCWGFDPGTLGAQPQDLVRLGATMAAAPPPPPPPPPPLQTAATAASGSGWWRALLFFLLGLLLLLGLVFLAGLLFGPAGCVSPNSLPAGCSALTERLPAGCAPAPPPVTNSTNSTKVDSDLISSLTAEQEKEKSLRRQLDDLRRELQKRAAECPRPPATPVEKPPVAEPVAPTPPAEKTPEPIVPPLAQNDVKPPEEPTPPEDTSPPDMENLLPTTPEEQEQPPVPQEPQQQKKPEKPKETPKPPKQKSGEEMRIPDDARKNNDVSFLEGCWNSETGLRSDRTNEPIGVQYCFDANGNGKRTITKQQSKDRCVGSVRAKFDSSGRLRIDSDGAACSKGGGFIPETVECTSSGGKADCSGAARDNKQRKWKARFRRS